MASILMAWQAWHGRQLRNNIEVSNGHDYNRDSTGYEKAKLELNFP